MNTILISELPFDMRTIANLAYLYTRKVVLNNKIFMRIYLSHSVGIIRQHRSKSREVSKPQNTIETSEGYATGSPNGSAAYRGIS